MARFILLSTLIVGALAAACPPKSSTPPSSSAPPPPPPPTTSTAPPAPPPPPPPTTTTPPPPPPPATSTAPAPTPTPTTPGVDYSIPSTWNVPSLNITYNQLSATAQSAMDIMKTTWFNSSTGIFTVGWWQSGSALSALAYKDMVASTNDNHDFVLQMLQAAQGQNSNFDIFGYNDDAQWWGTAAAYAHRTYGDQAFLDMATAVWNWVQPCQVTPDQAAAGSTPVRTVPIQSSCNGTSNAGGVFWRSQTGDLTDLGANVVTTGLFMTLSTYLAEATQDPKYVAAAQAAFDFMTNHLVDPASMLPTDTINLGSCGANNWFFTYNTGKFVEGTFALFDLTQNTTIQDYGLQVVTHAVKNTDHWQGADGIITEGSDGDPSQGGDGREFRAVYIRALTEVSRRQYRNPDLRKLLTAYINLQYNSLLTNDTDGKNDYGPVWKGPFAGPYDHGQMAALDVLGAGIEFNWIR